MRSGPGEVRPWSRPVKLRWRIAWLATYPLQRCLLHLRVVGRDRLGPGPMILAANHVSNFDPLIIGMAAAREVHFLAKDELFTASRTFAWLIRSWNAWPVKRGGADASAIRRCSWLLRRSQTLVLFPEGTRSKTGATARFRPGVGLLSTTNRTPVVPVCLTGVDNSNVSYWTDRDFVRQGFRRKPVGSTRITVTFGEPLSPAGFSSDRRGYIELTQAVEQRVRELAAGSGTT